MPDDLEALIAHMRIRMEPVRDDSQRTTARGEPDAAGRSRRRRPRVGRRNASQAAEAGIAAAVKRAREEAWLVANEAAITAHADWLDRHDVLLDPAWPE